MKLLVKLPVTVCKFTTALFCMQFYKLPTYAYVYHRTNKKIVLFSLKRYCHIQIYADTDHIMISVFFILLPLKLEKCIYLKIAVQHCVCLLHFRGRRRAAVHQPVHEVRVPGGCDVASFRDTSSEALLVPAVQVLRAAPKPSVPVRQVPAGGVPEGRHVGAVQRQLRGPLRHALLRCVGVSDHISHAVSLIVTPYSCMRFRVCNVLDNYKM